MMKHGFLTIAFLLAAVFCAAEEKTVLSFNGGFANDAEGWSCSENEEIRTIPIDNNEFIASLEAKEKSFFFSSDFIPAKTGRLELNFNVAGSGWSAWIHTFDAEKNELSKMFCEPSIYSGDSASKQSASLNLPEKTAFVKIVFHLQDKNSCKFWNVHAALSTVPVQKTLDDVPGIKLENDAVLSWKNIAEENVFKAEMKVGDTLNFSLAENAVKNRTWQYTKKAVSPYFMEVEHFEDPAMLFPQDYAKIKITANQPGEFQVKLTCENKTVTLNLFVQE